MPTFLVTPSEADQKLLQFLARRLHRSHSELHRWIRTGQVRVNGARRKAFDRVAVDDVVRVPPFVELETAAKTITRQQITPLSEKETDSPFLSLPKIVYEDENCLVLLKPRGLPTHPGTGHTDSLTTRLHAAFASAPFAPTPVHRLDRDTSGLLLVAKSYRALRRFSDLFAQREGICKEYLAWCTGYWHPTEPQRFETRLQKQTNTRGYEKMYDSATTGKEASVTVSLLRRSSNYSLLHLTLHTGRTHQIRAQLAALGHPLAGDTKYGAKPLHKKSATNDERFFLHAWRLRIEQQCFVALPTWDGEWRVLSQDVDVLQGRHNTAGDA